jgi:NitT/TauT family transport system ATP-binding protein/nitrate/nitrite transport system substrate-binding protein
MTALIRIGVLRLADSAPALVARAHGQFAELGLRADILIEPSWANILDKLTWGLLDAAIMLPPLALAAALGLRGPPVRLFVPMGLTAGGNSIVVNPAAADACAATADDAPAAAAGLLAWMRAQPARPRLGVVHMFSTHNLLLRDWLASAGGIPETDWETIVLPPEMVVDALAAGQVAGFCAGAPWGDVAATRGAGVIIAGSSTLRPGHPEKCLCVAAAWAESRPDRLIALTRALIQACAICADPAWADDVANLLAGIGLPRDECRRALPGGIGPEQIGFADAAASGPNPIWHADPNAALAMLEAMRAQGWLPQGIDATAASALYRPDLLLPAMQAEALKPRPISLKT